MNTHATDPVVLIHGAWQGAWVWDRLIPILAESAGLTTVAVDLPGNGVDETRPADVSLELYVEYIGAVLKRLPQPATLIAHSGGGIVASAVAERFPERVGRLVYIAGMMLPDGMAYADLVAELKPDHPDVAGIGPHLVWSDDRLSSRVPPQAARDYFFHDCLPADAAAAAERLTPQPERGRAVRARLTAGRFGRIPRLYVETIDDRSVILACQRRMQQLVPGAKVVTMSSGHAPHVSAPRQLADLLLPFLTAQDRAMVPPHI